MVLNLDIKHISLEITSKQSWVRLDVSFDTLMHQFAFRLAARANLRLSSHAVVWLLAIKKLLNV